jgi:lipopolysaccharide/colanic/teichoic acid biosynthesis glycosyltransferase
MYLNYSKRLIDFCLTFIGLIVLFPIILIIALLVYMFLGKPILFNQIRPGFKGKSFVMYKFRTMNNFSDKNGKLLPDVERLTRLGNFLRKTSLDELPELWNVLKGDMSLVGPRPLIVEYLSLYDKEQARRHDAKPGITGLAQVNGRNKQDWKKRLELDVWYVDNPSLLLDMKIFLKTVFVVISCSGISSAAHVTKEKFTGAI